MRVPLGGGSPITIASQVNSATSNSSSGLALDSESSEVETLLRSKWGN
jgi:hypothetical protein